MELPLCAILDLPMAGANLEIIYNHVGRRCLAEISPKEDTKSNYFDYGMRTWMIFYEHLYHH